MKNPIAYSIIALSLVLMVWGCSEKVVNPSLIGDTGIAFLSDPVKDSLFYQKLIMTDTGYIRFFNVGQSNPHIIAAPYTPPAIFKLINKDSL